MRRTLLIAPLLLLAIACGDEVSPKPPGCGDGEVSEDEICDDGNNEDGDGCSAECVPEQVSENCGNGVVDPLETCDDGNTANGDGCSATCDLESCGNGVVDPGEDCDDGNDINLDGCPNDCTKAKCGNGVIEAPYETCDPPNTAVCDSQCQGLPFCGDGEVEGDEQCDDGNFFGGDGCMGCQLEFCGDGYNNNNNQEQCDDGNQTDGDGCSALCVYEGCGDGTLQTGLGEVCDDGNTLGGDGCRSNCTPEVCGDGILDPDEACDDGNAVDDDGCGSDCKTDGCHDGVTTPEERCYTSFTAFPGSEYMTIVGKGDLDGDGRVDVVVDSSEKLVWMRNRGDGSLTPTTLFTGAPIRGTALGDVDADGDTDIVMAYGQDLARELIVLTNDGAGMFTKSSTPDQPIGGLTLADFDGDGDADLAVVLDGLGGLAVRENMGGGVFGAPKTLSMEPEGYGIVAGDLDGDLDLDLASFSPATNSLRFYPNQGNFTFGALVEVPIPTGNGSFTASVLLDDVDGDGLLDALTRDGLQKEIVIARNQGGFSFALQQVPIGDSASPALVFDADGDGDKDIFLSADVQAADPKGLSVLTNDGTGTFSVGLDLWVPEGVWLGPMVALDLEQDGDEDVVINTSYGLNALVYNPSQGFFPRQVVLAKGTASSILMGDVDGDGHSDAVLQSGGIFVARNDGTGHLLAPVQVPNTQSASRFALGDINGDGALDLVFWTSVGTQAVHVLSNDGAGNFGAPVPVSNVVDATVEIFVADLDVDGDEDILSVGSYGAQAILNDGMGGLSPKTKFTTAVGFDVDSAALVDRTGDGLPELIVGISSRVDTFENKGNGTFTQLATKQLDFVLGVLAAGDVDMDGQADLVVAPNIYGQLVNDLRLYKGMPGGDFSGPTIVPAGPQIRKLILDDLNLDGKLDIASVDSYDGKILLYFQNAAGQFVADVEFSNIYGYSLAVGRLNGDTLPDLLVSFSSTKFVSAILSSP